MLLFLAKERFKKKKRKTIQHKAPFQYHTEKKHKNERAACFEQLAWKKILTGEFGQHCSFSLTALIICLKEQEPAIILANRPAEEVEGLCGGFLPRGKLGLRPSGSWSLGEVLKLIPPGLGYRLWLPRFGTYHSRRPLSFRAQRAENESLPMFLSAGERMQGFHWFSQPALLLESRSPVQAMPVRP